MNLALTSQRRHIRNGVQVSPLSTYVYNQNTQAVLSTPTLHPVEGRAQVLWVASEPGGKRLIFISARIHEAMTLR